MKIGDPKDFRHTKNGPEIPQHKSRWDSKKCKRNKGSEHDMALIAEEVRTDNEYRTFRIAGYRVWESRPYQWEYQLWRCTHCGRKSETHYWDVPHTYIGEWAECRRTVDRKQPKS
ncbi:hypothetical protein HWB60_gp039 [Mycobacterium phage TChen]|uniref:Uncharacterized protein n=1 Tax=Mycobacterium phage TChen TaxID=2163598 RepID=A0A2S1PCZ8_9CAUD|nr:hypothetical protein HWB60_gp039 [Mycobacterium phage TChen]AWH14439.1 hypothetical protein SEA_TCHEN_39 [Mycobacterium phage TChen]